MYPLTFAVCQNNATEGGSQHYRGKSLSLSLAHDRLAILPPLWLVCNFSPCYRRTRAFLCNFRRLIEHPTSIFGSSRFNDLDSHECVSYTLLRSFAAHKLLVQCITECGSTLYLGIAMDLLNNWVFDHGIIQANKRQKPTTRLQIDLHCHSSQKH